MGSGLVRMISPTNFARLVFIPQVIIETSGEKNLLMIQRKISPVVLAILRKPCRSIRNNFDFTLYSFALPVIDITK